jgi:hypothetical protein
MLGRTSLSLLGALPLAVLALAACGGSASHALPTTSDGRPASIGVGSTGLGNILVDRQGRTLYLFARDSGMTSACTGACAVNWPPLRVRGTPLVGSGAKPSDVGRTARPSLAAAARGRLRPAATSDSGSPRCAPARIEEP